MIIVVEGPEGSGKSTLARQLAEQHKLMYFHTGGSGEPAQSWWPKIQEFVGYRNVVFDRFPSISEMVYARAMDRMQRASDGQLRELWGKLPEPQLIFCRPSSDKIIANCKARFAKPYKSLEEQGAVERNIRKLIVQYDEIMKHVFKPTTIHDWT